MRIRNFTLITFFLALISSGNLFAQTTYNYTSLTAPGCNIFNNGSGLTINGALHIPIVGGASYVSNKVRLSCTNGPDIGNNLANSFGIKYAIKKGYTYTVVAKCKIVVSGTSPLLELTPIKNVDPGTEHPESCGPKDHDAWSTLFSNAIGYATPTTTSADRTCVSGWVATDNFNYWDFLAISPYNPGVPTGIDIEEIVITETAPASTSFSVSPSSVVKSCGTGISQTFTVNGVNIPGGATVVYSWDLGTTTNRWYYGGSPAAQTISTGGSNTISLTDASCDLAPKNITVTATVNGGSPISAGTVTVSSSPSMLSGPTYICSGTTSAAYNISNLGCSPSVSWSVSPSGLVTVDNPSSSSTTLTYVSSGEGILTATYSGPCGSGTLTMPITSGSPVPKGVSNFSTNYGYSFNNPLQSLYAFLGTNHGNPGDNNASFNYTINDDLFSGLTWSVVSQPSGTNYQIVDNTTWMYVVMSGCTNCSLGITMNLAGTGPCGDYSQNFTSTAARINFGFRAALFPNPAASSTTVSLVPIEDKAAGSAEKAQRTAAPKPLIRAIQIANQTGVIVRTFEYKAGVSSINVPLNGLSAGIYKLSVFDGLNWTSQQLIIK